MRTSSHAPGTVRALSLVCIACALSTILPSMALASDVCAHPLSGGPQCLKVFATVSAVYALTASTYGLGAILIGKPRLTQVAFRRSLMVVPLVSWLAPMFGFTIAGAFGMLAYPHDSSPFFFLDWLTALVTFVATTIAVVLIYYLGSRDRA